MSSGTHLKLCRERFGHSNEITGSELLLCSALMLQVYPSLSGQPPSPLELPPRWIWTPYNHDLTGIVRCIKIAETPALPQVHMHCSSFPTWTPAGGRKAMAALPLRKQLIRKWHTFLPVRGLSAHPECVLQQESMSLHPVCAVRSSHHSHRSQHRHISAAPLTGRTSDFLSPNSVFDGALHEGKCKAGREPKEDFLYHQRHTTEGKLRQCRCLCAGCRAAEQKSMFAC